MRVRGVLWGQKASACLWTRAGGGASSWAEDGGYRRRGRGFLWEGREIVLVRPRAVTVGSDGRRGSLWRRGWVRVRRVWTLQAVLGLPFRRTALWRRRGRVEGHLEEDVAAVLPVLHLEWYPVWSSHVALSKGAREGLEEDAHHRIHPFLMSPRCLPPRARPSHPTWAPLNSMRPRASSSHRTPI